MAGSVEEGEALAADIERIAVLDRAPGDRIRLVYRGPRMFEEAGVGVRGGQRRGAARMIGMAVGDEDVGEARAAAGQRGVEVGEVRGVAHPSVDEDRRAGGGRDQISV